MSASTSTSTKTIAFFGASTGIALSALKHALAAGHTCIALARTPAKFDAHFPAGKFPNLTVKKGNAHNAEDVAACIAHPADATALVDKVVFSIGGAFDPAKFSIDDPDVCKKGMAALLEALKTLRAQGRTGSPRLIVTSSTGISKHQRDVPLLIMPMYHVMLKVPHADKRVMEEDVINSGESFTIIRPSFLVNGAKEYKTVRVGIEDPVKGLETKAVGYTISREDCGRWIYEELLAKNGEQYDHKALSVTW